MHPPLQAGPDLLEITVVKAGLAHRSLGHHEPHLPQSGLGPEEGEGVVSESIVPLLLAGVVKGGEPEERLDAHTARGV